MATVGGGAAYQQLQRLPNDLGQALEGIAGRQQADKRAAAKTNEDRRIAKAKAADDFKKGTVIDPAKFEVEATNWQDADEIFGAASQSAMDTSIDLYAQARNLWDSGKEEEARTLQQQAKRIETSFSNFASKREEFAAQINNTRELIKAGKVLTKSEGQFIDGLDRNEYTVEYVDGDFMLSVLMRDANGKIERDENGNAKYMQRSMNDVRKGLHRPFEFEEAMGKGGMIDNMMVNFGTSKYDKEQDQYIITEQKWDNGNEALLSNYIEGVIGKEGEDADNREMYKWYKNATGQEKMSDWTQEDKDIVAGYIREGVASQYEEEVAMKVRGMKASEKLADSAANRNLRRDLQEDAQEFKADEAAKDRAADWAELQAKLNADIEKAKLKTDKNGKGLTIQQRSKNYYDIALALRNTESDAEAQQVLDKLESGLKVDLGWDFQDGNAVDIAGGKGDINVKDTHALAQSIAQAVEGKDFKYDGTVAYDKSIGKSNTNTNTTGGAARFNKQ